MKRKSNDEVIIAMREELIRKTCKGGYLEKHFDTEIKNGKMIIREKK